MKHIDMWNKYLKNIKTSDKNYYTMIFIIKHFENSIEELKGINQQLTAEYFFPDKVF